MRTVVTIAAIATLISACVTNPIPDDYTGPRATINDTYGKTWSERAANFFFVDEVDGKNIADALSATTQSNYGRGFELQPAAYSRQVPAQSATFTIVGRTHYAAPILELTNPVYQVKGTVTFTPQPNHYYVVKGTLTPEYSAVWIEDVETKAVVGNKVEVKGKATLGVMEK